MNRPFNKVRITLNKVNLIVIMRTAYFEETTEIWISLVKLIEERKPLIENKNELVNLLKRLLDLSNLTIKEYNEYLLGEIIILMKIIGRLLEKIKESLDIQEKKLIDEVRNIEDMDYIG